MKHYIIIKFNDTIQNKAPMYERIEKLFKKAEEIKGIYHVSLTPNIIDLPNRYDLMIIMDMERSALPIFDASQIHSDWKKEYAEYLESKVIFDSN